jgi:hypothetical protein
MSEATTGLPVGSHPFPDVAALIQAALPACRINGTPSTAAE